MRTIDYELDSENNVLEGKSNAVKRFYEFYNRAPTKTERARMYASDLCQKIMKSSIALVPLSTLAIITTPFFIEKSTEIRDIILPAATYLLSMPFLVMGFGIASEIIGPEGYNEFDLPISSM